MNREIKVSMAVMVLGYVAFQNFCSIHTILYYLSGIQRRSWDKGSKGCNGSRRTSGKTWENWSSWSRGAQSMCQVKTLTSSFTYTFHREILELQEMLASVEVMEIL